MIKVYVIKTSQFTKKNGEIREYENLEECVNDLLKKENFGDFADDPLELVVSRPCAALSDVSGSSDYIVEIYDDWRE